MPRRPVTLAVPLVAALTLLVATACGGEDGEASGEISFLASGRPAELETYRAVIRAFRQREPEITVRLVEAAEGEDLVERVSRKSPPDVVLLDYRLVGRFSASGLLEPVAGRFEDSDAFEDDDFYPQALDAFRRDDELICVPQDVSSLVVYYNRDLFRAARVTEPSGGWRWHDMVAAAKKLTKDVDGDGDVDRYGLGVEPSLDRLAPFVWSNGGEVVSHPTRPTEFTLDSPRALGALQAFLDLGAKHRVVANRPDDEERFREGRLAMILASRRVTPAFRRIQSFDWDVAPLPVHAEPRGILAAHGYCLAEASDAKRAAWRFVEFALGREGQRITARSGGTVPSLREVAQSDAFLDASAKPANSRIFVDLIGLARRLPSISTWPEIEAVAARHLGSGLYEEVPARAVARRLKEETRALFARGE